MTDDDLKSLLDKATAAAIAAKDTAAGATAEAANVRRRQRTLARAVIALGVALFVLLLLVSAVLVYLVPTAQRNSRNLAVATHTLDIIERVTGPDGRRAGQASTAIAICDLKNENAMLHGHPEGAPGCSPAEMAALAEAATPPKEAP